MFRRVLPVAGLVFCLGLLPDRPFAAEPIAQRELPPIPLSVDEIHAWIDRSHPLLKGAGDPARAAFPKSLRNRP